MHWFNGGIPEAILSSKQRNIPFIVYIEGSDESSIEMGKIWDNSKVSDILSPEKCVAIKLNNESEQCKQFSQLYPVVCVPSIFFIGSTGMPLEVIGGAITADALIEKSNTALEAFRKEIQPSTAAVAPQDSQTPSTSTSEQVTTNESTIEERVERAKRLIEEKRKQKAEQEKKEKKEKEERRRAEGQQLTLAKKEREERRQQELVNQIREDRAKEKAAREAIRQKIAQDKAEREAKRKEDKREAISPQQTIPSTSTTSNMNTTRLQFRLPDGGSIIETFQSDALLEAARQFVISQTSHKAITLTMVYPRRQLTDEDMLQTLKSLGLSPNSTLIVSPATTSSLSKGNSSGSFLMMILGPFFALLNFIKVFLFGGSSQQRGGDNLQGGREQNFNTESTNNDLRKRNTRTRDNTQGNIHRLRNQDDDDDENSTWNGNSTQQM